MVGVFSALAVSHRGQVVRRAVSRYTPDLTMLLTLSTNSLNKLMAAKAEPLHLLDIPALAYDKLDLRGLNVAASMLKGWSMQELDALRDAADKAHCPCLVLFDDVPLPFAAASPAERDSARERLQMIGKAAHRLGCNSIAVKVEAPDTDEALELAANEIKNAMAPVERLELNVLLSPEPGLTADPDRLTELIKTIGGFRIGSLPDFGSAAATGDAIGALRKLAPYAQAIHATIKSFSKNGSHSGYDLNECVQAVRSVGFENTLAIEYIGKADPIAAIDKAREQLQQAIEDEQGK